MQKKSRPGAKIRIRNTLLILAAFAVITAATEFLLGTTEVKTYSQEELLLQEQENTLIQWMDLEKFYLSPDDTAENAGGAQDGSGSQDDADDPGGFYPLLDYMQTDLPYDDDTVNIVVLGDSFVWGRSCINRNEVFWRLLENDLRAKGYNVRVSGVAIFGANSVEELRWLSETSLMDDLSPDLVIFGYVYNDPDLGENSPGIEADGDSYRITGFVSNGVSGKILSAVGKLLPNIAERLSNYITAKTMYSDDGWFVPVYGNPPVLKGEIYDSYERDFIAPLDDFSEKTGLPVAIMTLPLYQGEIIQKALFRPLHELCEKYDHIALFDCLDALYHDFVSAAHRNNYMINIADAHPGSALNRFYADFAASIIEKNYGDILGNPSECDLRPKAPIINDALPGRTAPTLLDVRGNEYIYEVHYPSKVRNYDFADLHFERYYLTLPLNKDHIALSFAAPAALESVALTGDDATGIELSYMCINEKLGYDDHTVYTPEEENGVWKFEPDKRVTTLLIHADCRNDDGARLTLKITGT